jgi:chromosome segregation ATPase
MDSVDLTREIDAMYRWVSPREAHTDDEAPEADTITTLRAGLEQLMAAKRAAAGEERYADAAAHQAKIVAMEAEIEAMQKTDAASVVGRGIAKADTITTLRDQLCQLMAEKKTAAAEERYADAATLQTKIAAVEAEIAAVAGATAAKQTEADHLRKQIVGLQGQIDKAVRSGDDVEIVPTWTKDRRAAEKRLAEIEK